MTIHVPLHDARGVLYVPNFLDELSPAIAEARAAAAKAKTDDTLARSAAREARDAYYALAQRGDDGEFRPRDDVTAAAFDKARLAKFKAEGAELSAARAAERAREAFYDIASSEAQSPEVADVIVKRWEAADAATGAAWDAFRSALTERTELDKLVGVRTLPFTGLQIAAQSTKPGEVLRVREVADEHFGDAYALTNAEAIAKPARVIEGRA